MLPSASLIPQDDPTLLIIGAGMAPFKPFFTGKMKPPATRITTCQKCVRTGDIENVGRTARHHTYFEMLGNFSFGDYFKKEVIPWSWEFLTKELGLPADKLYITIHTEDDEAFDIWHNVVGVPEDHIVRLADNWWEIGSGPCGPDSEIHIDLGPERGCGKPTCGPGCDCDRFLEIWNLVFTQFNQMPDGTYPPLKNKNIDTGAGLERLASVVQGKPSNFETDLIFPIIEYAAKIANVEYGKDKATDVSLKVIADHVRSMTFMIGDGILPSNEGRGYVLRRILRRAIRHARLLGINEMFLTGAVDVVIGMFGHAYPNLVEKADFIKKVVEMEETSFLRTLKQGCELLNEEIEKLKAANKTVLDGATAFKLNDTFGFPWELTEEILEEAGMTMDKEGFDAALEVQRKMAREARNDKEGRPVVYNTSGINVAELKVDEAATEAKIVKMYPAHDAQPIENAADGTDVAVICDVTAFHAEGGGQLGDIGTITAPTGVIAVNVTKKLPDGAVIMIGSVTEGTVAVGDAVTFAVDKARKMDIARNHTATHLLHAALKQVLGNDVDCTPVIFSTSEETPTHRLGTYYLETGYGIRPSKVIYDRKHSAFDEYDFTKVDLEKLLDGYTWLHLSGITPALGERCRKMIIDCLKIAKKNGITISFDGNFRSTLWSWEEAREFCTACLPYVDILMGIEPYHLWKDENNYSAGDVKDDIPFQPDLEQQEIVFNAFVKRYPNLKCIARHVRYSPSCSENSLKAYLWYEGKTYESRKLTFNILDRVGGGDAFVSGIIYALMQKFTPEDTVNFGVASSAIKHTLHGDGNITDDVSLIRHVMQMNFDIKR